MKGISEFSLCLSVRQSVCLFLCLFVCLSLYPCVCLSVSFRPEKTLSCLSVCLSVCLLDITVFVDWVKNIKLPTLSLSVYLSVCLFVSLFVYVSVSVCLPLSLLFLLSLSLSPSLSLLFPPLFPPLSLSLPRSSTGSTLYKTYVWPRNKQKRRSLQTLQAISSCLSPVEEMPSHSLPGSLGDESFIAS